MADGRLVALRRYPIKSMMGEELNRAELTGRGLLGDRALALIDVETGKVVSAKNPRKWPEMFSFQAQFLAPPVAGQPLPPVGVTMPDGTWLTTDRPGFASEVSRALGREVVLASAGLAGPSLEEYWPDLPELNFRDVVTDEGMPEGTFFDLATLHLLTTASLNQLSELCPGARFEARRFRPNLVIEPAEDHIGFVEGKWIGQDVRIGDEVVVSITGHCPRCVMTTLAQGDLPRDTDVLRTAARHNDVHVGVYAEVRHAGVIRRGDPVLLC